MHKGTQMRQRSILRGQKIICRIFNGRVMRVKDFEEAISAKGLTPREVRLREGQVRWFLCSREQNHDLIIYDEEGKAYVAEDFSWPEDISQITITRYPDTQQRFNFLMIKYHDAAMRDELLDLKL